MPVNLWKDIGFLLFVTGVVASLLLVWSFFLQRQITARTRSLEKEIAERRKVEDALRISEQRFRSIFENSPAAIWEEDFTEVRQYFDQVKQSGNIDFRRHFDEHPEVIGMLAAKVKIVEINQVSVALVGAKNKDEVILNLASYFTDEAYPVFKEEMIALATGQTRFESDIKLKNLAGETLTYHLVLIVQPGYEATLGRVLVTFRDITERIRGEAALRDSEEKFRKAFVISPDAVNINRLQDGLYVAINQGFTTITGFTEADTIGKTSAEINIWYDPEDRKKLIKGLSTSGVVHNLEARFRKKNGAVINGLMSASVIELGGVQHILSISRDITGMKESQQEIEKALEEKETLLRELYHRTKNNMQVIIALLDLQASQINDDRLTTAFNEIQNKIRSMALVHQKLYEASDLSHISLKDYFTDLISLLATSYQAENGQLAVEADLENISVVVDTAVPCGLILNELITNSFKHAFQPGQTGQIHLNLHREEADIVMSYCDNGPGVPKGFDFRRDGNMGIKTVFVLVENQLRGQVEFSSQQGVRCDLRFTDSYYKPRI